MDATNPMQHNVACEIPLLYMICTILHKLHR